MARRKRASMREGPLADLFRSTTGAEEGAKSGEEKPAEPGAGEEAPTREEGAPEAEAAPKREPAIPEEEMVPESEAVPEPDEVNVYRVEDEVEHQPPAEPPTAKERLEHAFTDESSEIGPIYGRQERSGSRSVGAPQVHLPVIRVVGVGGAGVNAINRMVEARISGVEFLGINTDLQSLQQSTADVTVHIGGEVTRGLGSGSVPALGYQAAFEEQDKIKRLLKGSDMVFVTAGAGGGTGTGAAPVIARLARSVGALTVGIVTKPFGFEGNRRNKQAQEGIDALGAEVDTLIVIPNERLLSILSRNTSMVEAFRVADDVLRQGVQGIADLVTLPALINLDFADVRTIMRDAGPAILGIGMGTGDSRATFAAERAISSPLLDSSVDGARSILLSVTGGSDVSLVEVSEAARVIQEAAHPDANIIFGANVDESLDEQVWVTVIATRFDGRGRRSDGSSQGITRRTTRPSTQRPAGRKELPELPKPDVGPSDLGIEAPEFEPSR
jgi:cell division protein FtsZ